MLYIHYVILKWFMNQRGQALPWSQASTATYHNQAGLWLQSVRLWFCAAKSGIGFSCPARVMFAAHWNNLRHSRIFLIASRVYDIYL